MTISRECKNTLRVGKFTAVVANGHIVSVHNESSAVHPMKFAGHPNYFEFFQSMLPEHRDLTDREMADIILFMNDNGVVNETRSAVLSQDKATVQNLKLILSRLTDYPGWGFVMAIIDMGLYTDVGNIVCLDQGKVTAAIRYAREGR